MIDTPNDMLSDLKWTAKSLMVGRKNNQTINQTNAEEVKQPSLLNRVVDQNLNSS